jgi:hypothetical protein
MAAAGEELLLVLGLGLDLGAAGDKDLVGDAEGFGFGEGEAVFSVVTDTVGSEGVVSGSGEEVTCCATANGPAIKRAARQRTVIFIGFS